ncbi:hypothetical protein [Pseudochrobactrum kiredjianiae]|uniref:Uncharacterized protein n=1 Tax=Pseudochrobactrum kiredjianiae TaxID=386305 RepID=A0ABW3UYV1_9HYPH|nr:hypothetical protein [Pseudochrobactrum kiredjianiae]MDM7852821.1 hypothetical protein [Pseudochrobactrum kiredjianiae]
MQQGISLLYDVETKIENDKNQVIAIIQNGHDPVGPKNLDLKVNPQLKSLLEGNLSGLMLLTSIKA